MREKHVSLRVRNRTAYNYCIPVQNCRKFSAVRGHTSRNNSIFSRPAAVPPIEISKKTTGFPRLTASATLVSISPTYLIYTRSLPTSHGNMHSHSFPSPRPGYTHTPIHPHQSDHSLLLATLKGTLERYSLLLVSTENWVLIV